MQCVSDSFPHASPSSASGFSPYGFDDTLRKGFRE